MPVVILCNNGGGMAQECAKNGAGMRERIRGNSRPGFEGPCAERDGRGAPEHVTCKRTPRARLMRLMRLMLFISAGQTPFCIRHGRCLMVGIRHAGRARGRFRSRSVFFMTVCSDRITRGIMYIPPDYTHGSGFGEWLVCPTTIHAHYSRRDINDGT
jgi:hypothetical protein